MPADALPLLLVAAGVVVGNAAAGKGPADVELEKVMESASFEDEIIDLFAVL